MTIKFELGHIVATPAALEALAASGQEAAFFLAKHHRGDWGDVDNNDKQANEQALRDEGRIFSAYKTLKGVKIWIITEADRSATTILLPEDY
jgi:hypothetical protein